VAYLREPVSLLNQSPPIFAMTSSAEALDSERPTNRASALTLSRWSFLPPWLLCDGRPRLTPPSYRVMGGAAARAAGRRRLGRCAVPPVSSSSQRTANAPWPSGPLSPVEDQNAQSDKTAQRESHLCGRPGMDFTLTLSLAASSSAVTHNLLMAAPLSRWCRIAFHGADHTLARRSGERSI
jgi:hypothetical protein